MSSPLDRLLSAVRAAVRSATGSAVPACPETVVLDGLIGGPFRPGAHAVEPARTPAVANWLDAAVRAAATPLANALARASPHLRWVAPYRAGDGADELETGYAATMFSMPGGPAPRDDYRGALRETGRPAVVHAAGPGHPLSFAPPQGGGDLSRHLGNGALRGATASRGDAVRPANGFSTPATRVTPCEPSASPCSASPPGSTIWIVRRRCWRRTSQRRGSGGREAAPAALRPASPPGETRDPAAVPVSGDARAHGAG